MQKIKKNKYPTPFSSDEREILKKWSNHLNQKFLTPFQEKFCMKLVFSMKYLKRFSQITMC